MKRVNNAEDVERALQQRGIEWTNGRGKTREAQLDKRTHSVLRWQEGEEFSEPRAAYFTGILKVFGIILFWGVLLPGGLMVLFAALAFAMGWL